MIRDVCVLSVSGDEDVGYFDDDVKYPGSSVGNFGEERRRVEV